MSIGGNSRSRNRWRHIGDNSKSSVKNRKEAGLIEEDCEQDMGIEESKTYEIDKGRKVANQGSKSRRDEEGEEDTESMLNKEGNTDSWKMQWGEI